MHKPRKKGEAADFLTIIIIIIAAAAEVATLIKLVIMIIIVFLWSRRAAKEGKDTVSVDSVCTSLP